MALCRFNGAQSVLFPLEKTPICTHEYLVTKPFANKGHSHKVDIFAAYRTNVD